VHVASRGICAAPSLPENDIRRILDENAPVQTIFPLSAQVETLLQGHEGAAKAIIGLLHHSEVLYKSAWAASVMVFRINESLVVKAGHEGYSITEHQSLAYLQDHKPSFPAPKPHGLVRIGVHCFLFTSYIPGIDLEKVWPDLDSGQKQRVSDQVDNLVTELRTIPFPTNAPLGSVGGGGCKDLRRTQRVSTQPIMSVDEFEDFVFNRRSTPTPTPLYTGLLRSLMPKSATVVFTHGDLRPANIMMRQDNDGIWTVAALIDWESTGFYPDYWEAVKMTNLLTPKDDFDWYRFIPKSISPTEYPMQWLINRIWDRSVTYG
jgi:hypothetical protein